MVFICCRKMKMLQEQVFTSKTRTLRREPFSILLRPSKSLLTRVSSGTNKHLSKTSFADSEKTPTTMSNSSKTTSPIGSPSCGGATKFHTSKPETATKSSTVASLKVKKLIPYSVWQSRVFNLKILTRRPNSITTLTSSTTSKELLDSSDYSLSPLRNMTKDLLPSRRIQPLPFKRSWYQRFKKQMSDELL